MINYYLLTKPGIILGNLFTVAAGFLLATNGSIDIKLFFVTLTGLGFVMASACVLNNYIDQPIDRKMERTQDRPLVKGTISEKNAIYFAIILGVMGAGILWTFTNLLTLLIAIFGFLVYVVLYSLWKAYTEYGTAIGSIAGAVPPVVGYCSVSNNLDSGAIILFLMLVSWQMPHFFAIALLHLKDYTAAKIPVLPVKHGMHRTKIHMVIYIMSFIFIALLLPIFNYTGQLFLIFTLIFGLTWLYFGIKGLKKENDPFFAKTMFYQSLQVMAAICMAIAIEKI